MANHKISVTVNGEQHSAESRAATVAGTFHTRRPESYGHPHWL